MKNPELDDKISRIMGDADQVNAAIQRGVRAALLFHKKLGNSVCVGRNGKVVWIPAEEIPIKDNN